MMYIPQGTGLIQLFVAILLFLFARLLINYLLYDCITGVDYSGNDLNCIKKWLLIVNTSMTIQHNPFFLIFFIYALSMNSERFYLYGAIFTYTSLQITTLLLWILIMKCCMMIWKVQQLLWGLYLYGFIKQWQKCS